MESNKGKEELKEALMVASILAEENPCRIGDSALGLLAKTIKTLIGKDYTHGMNQEEVAKYLGISQRTLQRWANEKPGFPKGRHDGSKELMYDPLEVIEWKRSN